MRLIDRQWRSTRRAYRNLQSRPLREQQNCRGWVEMPYRLESDIVGMLLVQPAQRLLQSLPCGALAGARLANQHVAMPGHLTVMDLNDLGDQLRNDLQD